MSLKLIIMGSGGVGKSAITCRYTQGVFQEKYDPTIEDKYTKDLEVNGKALQLEILDTAGQEEYSALRETFMHTGDGFILVFSITDDSTFEALKKIREEILAVHPNPKVPILIVGNKKDLEDERAVTNEEGEAMATEFGGDVEKVKYVEVSAFEDAGVVELFDDIVCTIFEKNPEAGLSSTADSKAVLGAGIAAPENTKREEDIIPEAEEKKEQAKKKEKTKKKKKCTIL